MRQSIILIVCALCLCSCHLAKDQAKTITFDADMHSNLKNPYMGWTLYSEGKQRHTDGKAYWQEQDEAARKYAGVFYVRWKWEDFEPEEGHYAWEHDSVFINLIQGALERNLRLAFRVVVHTGTPQYVLDGAETYKHWNKQTPYPDDAFFLEKYTRFIAAFGKKFNDPTLVDYIDSYGLGWWGEEHNIKYKDENNKYQSHDRIVKAYAIHFNKVLNVINFGVRDEKQKAVVYDELGFVPRRDGYASKWFPEEEQKALLKHFPRAPIIAEACYWGTHEMDYHIEHEDGKKLWDTWADYYKDVVDLALQTHANYLDMRTRHETRRYVEEAPEQAQKFLSFGGYRILPTSISVQSQKGQLNIDHTWTNVGVGIFPNNNRNLDYKYKIAFALFDAENQLVKKHLSHKVEPSQLLEGKKITASEMMSTLRLKKGKYQLAVGIINTQKNDSKDIKLAIKDAEIITDEWVLVSDIELD